eukprot:TRINITY_DN2591_c0_g1_i11.p2 TRINITY_DN2591_c0_g1~~TRINITY_DN2591_c0_g1_i11.p2  ORF type:complete len:227 (-),score=11.77 TRINITY_DN2591_c0_g1_i11:159-839(-)
MDAADTPDRGSLSGSFSGVMRSDSLLREVAECSKNDPEDFCRPASGSIVDMSTRSSASIRSKSARSDSLLRRTNAATKAATATAPQQHTASASHGKSSSCPSPFFAAPTCDALDALTDVLTILSTVAVPTEIDSPAVADPLPAAADVPATELVADAADLPAEVSSPDVPAADPVATLVADAADVSSPDVPAADVPAADVPPHPTFPLHCQSPHPQQTCLPPSQSPR